MSKLAHSNDETMVEIDLKNLGMYKLLPPKPRLCEGTDDGVKCNEHAVYIDYDGDNSIYCEKHAIEVSKDKI